MSNWQFFFQLKGYDCCIGLAKFLTEIKKETNCQVTVEPPHWFKGEKGSRVQSPHERVTVIAESLSAPQETAGRCHCGFGCEKTREGVVRRSQETCLTVENGPRFGTCFRVSLVFGTALLALFCAGVC